ncbi:MAG: hypothetical protein EXX96DRAFT_564238, partial [Benjaminiella poitrasii]
MNLKNKQQCTTTAVVERPTRQETTAVVEHSMTEDDLTHPTLYRFKMNSIPCNNFHKAKYNTSSNTRSNSNGEVNSADWDLYPGLMRDIENEGSPKLVEELHKMELNKK